MLFGLILASSGEPIDGFPSWEERVVEVWVNRARADPQADLAGCSSCGEAACYSPAPPMSHNHALARAARFHAVNLSLSRAGLQHDSPCTLVSNIGELYTPGPCDGSPSCACEGGATGCSAVCTSFSTRVSLFGAGPRAENAAASGGDPVSTFYQWLHEADADPSCGWRPSNGHRANILGDATAIGVGSSGGFFVQDFSYGSPSGRIVVGSHYPESGRVGFRAAWYDESPPSRALVAIDGRCLPMSLERGVEPSNATYLADEVVDRCVRYYFVFEDAAGGVETYPSTGAFGAGCGFDWELTRPAPGPSCGPGVPMPDAGPADLGVVPDSGSSTDLGMTAPDAGSIDALVDDASSPQGDREIRDGSSDSSVPGDSGPDELEVAGRRTESTRSGVGGGCACSVRARVGESASLALWVLGALSLARRRVTVRESARIPGRSSARARSVQ
ncbi:MAG: CAP domain-containing protein [Deltaproteobacteria bacterium]|nr:CAP domain-containing protein [Deltaproteobacteria bacterium]